MGARYQVENHKSLYVLGPVLFLDFLSMTLLMRSRTGYLKLQNDDTNVFGVIINESDSRILNEDLSKLFQCSEDWQMFLNIKKCDVSHIGIRNQQFKYYMNSQELEVVCQEKTGVTFTDDLKSATQRLLTYKKGSRTLDMTTRTITYESKDTQLELNLYKTLAMQHLEYSSLIW